MALNGGKMQMWPKMLVKCNVIVLSLSYYYKLQIRKPNKLDPGWG